MPAVVFKIVLLVPYDIDWSIPQYLMIVKISKQYIFGQTVIYPRGRGGGGKRNGVECTSVPDI
jgi:hypothetical protein